MVLDQSFLINIFLLHYITGTLFLSLVHKLYPNMVFNPYNNAQTSSNAIISSKFQWYNSVFMCSVPLQRKDSKVIELNMKDQDKLLKELSRGTEWQKKITELVILRDLRAFLADTKRALCRLERRSKKNTSLEQM